MKPTVDQTTNQQAGHIATSSNTQVNTGALSREEIASRLPSSDASIRRTFEASLHARTQSQWDALVETHCAVNRGARAASNLLLSLRGGISPKLASAVLEGDKQPSREEIAFRRTLIALSYLTVEDTINAPHDLRIGGLVDFQKGEELAGRLNDELRAILHARGESDEAIQEWLNDCSPALSAAVRDDAVWVNRAKGFDKLQEHCGETLTSDEVWDLLQHVVGTPSEYFDFSGVDTGSEEEVAQRDVQFERDSDKIAIACQRWLGQRFGAGEGLDYKGLSTFYESLADSIAQGNPEATGEQIVREVATNAGLSLPQSLANGRAAAEVASDLSRQLGLKGMATVAFTKAVEPLITTATLTADERKSVQEKISKRLSDAQKNIGAKGEREWATKAFHDVVRASGFEYRGLSPRTDTRFSERDRSQEFSLIMGAAGEQVSALHTNVRKAEANRFSASGALRRFNQDAATERQPATQLIEAIERELGDRIGQEGYCIRPRSITGWPELVQLWRANATTEEDRLSIVRKDLPEVLSSATPPVKIGNPQLFELLAKEENKPIWSDASGNLSADRLIEYVKYQEALEKVARYKVIRFCHPDALLHPVFLQIATRGFKAEFGASSHLAQTQAGERRVHSEERGGRGSRALSIDLFDGANLSRHHFQWSSNRFFEQIVNGNESAPEAVAVSRISRMGKAAAGVAGDTPVYSDAKSELFARVILKRNELERIAAKLEGKQPEDREREMVAALKEIDADRRSTIAKLMISAKITPRGPAHQYSKEHGVDLLAPTVHREFNKQKGLGTLAKRRLSHLPALRVLGVHFGVGQVALSVWETLGSSEARELMTRHGQTQLPADDVPFVALPALPNAKKGAPGPVLRRLGANTLADEETPHPAPWAVHRRSSLLVAPGSKDIRLASNRELALMGTIANLTGVTPRFLTKRPTILNLMHAACDTVKRALDKQRPVASIAYVLRAISDKESAEEAQTAFEATIRQWCDLVCKDSGNRSGTLGEVFASHIHPYISSPAWLKLLEDHGNKRGKSSKYLAARDELLAPVFAIFADDAEARANLAKLASDDLTQRWQAGDVAIQQALRETRQLIRPSQSYLEKAGEEVAGVRSHVGGLSQRRLATLMAYKDLLQAFDRRPSTEEKYRGLAERFESFGVGAGKRVRKHIVTLREEYAQVMASRIIEAALGLGGEPGKAAANKHNGALGKRDLPRKDTFERSESNGQTPVIVMENLANYAPVQTQGRRENAQLQRWLSQRVTELVQQSAQEHGLRVELVSPHRVSQRDAYTFGAGVRVAQVSVADFVREAGVHAKQIDRALEKIESGVATKFDQYLADLVAKWDPTTRTWEDASGRIWTLRGSTWNSPGMQSGAAPQAVLVPDPAGDLFVSENAELSGRLYRNAEINAASNVALRPLCDPVYPGTWSVVPIDATTGRPLDSMKGTAYEPEQQLVAPVTPREERAKTSTRVKASRGAIPRPKKNAGGSNVRNAYRNPMNREDSWQLHAEREAAIEAQVVKTLRTIHGLRVD